MAELGAGLQDYQIILQLAEKLDIPNPRRKCCMEMTDSTIMPMKIAKTTPLTTGLSKKGA